MNPTASPVAVTRRPHKRRRDRRITITTYTTAPAACPVLIEIIITGGVEGGLYRRITPRTAAELQGIVQADVAQLAARLWGGS